MGDHSAGGGLEEDIGRSTFTNLFFVGGILAIALSVPWIFVDSMFSGGRRKRDPTA
jgi:hypothetical protein